MTSRVLDKLFPEWAAIRRTEAHVDTVQWTAEHMIQRHDEEMVRLRALVEGLVEVLEEKIGLDPQLLESAVQRAWARMTSLEDPPGAAATDPYRGLPAAPAPAAATRATCERCGRAIDAAHTTVGLDGEVRCDRCG